MDLEAVASKGGGPLHSGSPRRPCACRGEHAAPGHGLGPLALG